MTTEENPGVVSGALEETGDVSGIDDTSTYVVERLLHARRAIQASLEMAEPPKKASGSSEKPAKPRKSYANTSKVFAEDPVLQHLGINSMGGRLAWKKLPPWRPAGQSLRSVTDHDLVKVDEVMCWYYGGDHGALGMSACESSRIAHAGSHRFSPWRDYIAGLPAWDGVDRLTTSIPTVRGLGTPYVDQTMLNFWLGMMQRAYEPGSQVDSMLVIQGGQGVRKTSWFRAIPPPDLPIVELDSVPSSTENKDAMAMAHQAPIALIDEMDKLRKKDDQSSLKAFVTGREDTWRSPYGKVDQTHRRAFIIAGTTNKPEFLIDITGNRRYPVIVVDAQIPSENLTRERMDLQLAEARDRYLRGERLDYSADYEAQAEEAREAHIDDPIREAVHDWLADPEVAPGVRLDTRLVSVALLCQHVRDLADLELKPGSMRDRMTLEKVEAAMDAHPLYSRCAGRKTVAGKKVRKAWERKPEPAGAPQIPTLDERAQRLLAISAAARKSEQFLKDPEVFQVGQLHATWQMDQRWDEGLAEFVEGTAAGQQSPAPAPAPGYVSLLLPEAETSVFEPEGAEERTPLSPERLSKLASMGAVNAEPAGVPS